MNRKNLFNLILNGNGIKLQLSNVVAGNNIEDKGTKSLGNSLEKNSVLTILDLSCMC